MFEFKRDNMLPALEQSVAYSLTPLTRSERASTAQVKIHQSFIDQNKDKQEGFLAFVLGQYVKQGVDELSEEKLKSLLKLKYQSIADATLVLDNPQAIRKMFVGFQQHLYSK